MDLSGIREASRLIFVDELTGLYNRRFMRQYLRERLDQLARERTSLAVIMLDLDGFKQVNDTYGHLDGDLILKRLAELILASLPANAYAIRFAGDEFFAFVEGIDASEGVRVAEAIRERVNTERFVTEKAPDGIPVRISLGVAAYPEDAPSPSELIEAADQALYRSKRAGKNCVSRTGGWMLPPEVEILKRFPCPRLVSREAALAELERPLSNGAERNNTFLLVEAGRGLGKTRLLLEVMRRVGARGFTCLFGRCLDSQRAVPYSSLTRVLAGYLAQEPRLCDALRERLSAQTLKELGALIPALGPSEGAGEGLAPEERRSILFHGMVDLLCLLSEHAPLLLFLDDLHFVDEASLEVLYRLLDREDGKVIVYAAAQSEALARQEGGPLPLARLFALLRQSPNFLRIGLGSLPVASVTEMVTEILQRHTASPAFFQRLHEASEGIPLFVEETLKGLISKGLLRTTDGMWNLDGVEPAAVPASLEAAVLGGLEALDQEFHNMITKAAVVGPHVDVELLAGVLGKNAAETQQLVDQGKKRRMFEEPGPLVDEDEVRFLSQCFQQIVYSNLDQDNRRKTHRTVGEVAERLAGDRVDKVLGPLAYHFERSDNAAKGEFYRQRVQELSGQLFSAAEIARELSLKVGDVEGVRRLDERTWPFADRFLRALTVAIKNMRVYPAGSQLVVHNAAAAEARLLELLGRVEAVTFAEESQTLQINGEPVESVGLVPVAQDLVRVYADHGIRRITLERGMTETDVMGLMKILSGSPQGIRHDVAYWENRLKSDRVGHVRVFPVIFLAAAGEGRAVWRREEKEAQLDDPTLALVRDTLRALAAAVDNIRLYPPESELITLSLDQLERQAQALFTRIPSLTVGMAEGTIIVNATRPNPRLFGITIEILEQLMQDGGLTSLTLRRGVTREDLRLFLTHLSQPPSEAKGGPAFWRSVLGGRGILTIEVGTRTYAAAARLEEEQVPEPEAPAPQESGAPQPPKPSEAERLLELADRWLKDPLEVFLEPQVQEELASVLGGLRRLGREDLATQLVGRTAGAFREADGTVRGRAAQGVSHCMARMEDSDRPWLLEKILEPLCGAVQRETQREAFQAEVALATEILNRLVGAGEFASAARLGEALGGSLHSLGPEGEWFSGVVRGLVDALAAAGVIETVLDALKDPDPTRRQQAGAILGGLGTAAVPLLLGVILEGKNEEIYRAAAAILRAQGEASVRLLTQKLERSPALDRVTRIVAVLDVVLPGLRSEFLFLLGHPEVEVRAEMAQTLSRLPREQIVRFLGQALGQRKSEVVVGALECVRGLRAVEMLDSVVRLSENPPNAHVQRMACLCLGGLKDPSAVPPLVEILGRRPRFFGLVKGLSEAIRATAARSLGELAFPEAEEALQVGLRDRSKTVRSASRLALLRIQQQLEAKPKS
ncbi:MAG: diguanylate cyclase [Candidatus Rokubacteria bacterium]|nr:diguanylate cyclase [Candidatus Rokubacteria bacterium]